jgi:hypothetical protein
MFVQIIGELLGEVVLAPLAEVVLTVVFYVPGAIIVSTVTLGKYPEDFLGGEWDSTCYAVGVLAWATAGVAMALL